jgi:hypothetical protein
LCFAFYERKWVFPGFLWDPYGCPRQLHNELKVLPDTMSKVGDYGAATCSEMLLHLLEQQGYEHFKAFGSQSFEFPSSEDVPAPSKTVDLITKIILRNFWAKSG